MLSAHIEVKRCLTERGDDGGVLQQLKTSKAYDCELDIAGIVIRADSMLVELFDGSFAGTDERDDEMTVVREALDVRGLKAMAIWVRMVLGGTAAPFRPAGNRRRGVQRARSFCRAHAR